jgi:hypothetical protein
VIALALGVLGGFEPLPVLPSNSGESTKASSKVRPAGSGSKPRPQAQTRTVAPERSFSDTPSHSTASPNPLSGLPRHQTLPKISPQVSGTTTGGSTSGQGVGLSQPSGKPLGSPGNGPGGSGAPGQLH